MVFKRVCRFAVQAIGIPIDNFNVATVTFHAFEANQVGASRALKQNRSLDLHKINIAKLSGGTKT
jgi:hypothetical protein